MNRSVGIVLGLLLIGAGLVCLIARVALADQLTGVMPIVVSSLGVVGVLAGGGLLRRAFRNRPPS